MANDAHPIGHADPAVEEVLTAANALMDKVANKSPTEVSADTSVAAGKPELGDASIPTALPQQITSSQADNVDHVPPASVPQAVAQERDTAPSRAITPAVPILPIKPAATVSTQDKLAMPAEKKIMAAGSEAEKATKVKEIPVAQSDWVVIKTSNVNDEPKKGPDEKASKTAKVEPATLSNNGPAKMMNKIITQGNGVKDGIDHPVHGKLDIMTATRNLIKETQALSANPNGSKSHGQRKTLQIPTSGTTGGSSTNEASYQPPPPKTLRVVPATKAPTSKVETQVQSAIAALQSPLSVKSQPGKGGVVSTQTPATPTSDFISEQASLTSTSISRASSPPLASGIMVSGKKKRREAKKEFKLKEMEKIEGRLTDRRDGGERSGAGAAPEVIAPIVGRKKKKPKFRPAPEDTSEPEITLAAGQANEVGDDGTKDPKADSETKVQNEAVEGSQTDETKLTKGAIEMVLKEPEEIDSVECGEKQIDEKELEQQEIDRKVAEVKSAEEKIWKEAVKKVGAMHPDYYAVYGFDVDAYGNPEADQPPTHDTDLSDLPEDDDDINPNLHPARLIASLVEDGELEPYKLTFFNPLVHEGKSFRQALASLSPVMRKALNVTDDGRVLGEVVRPVVETKCTVTPGEWWPRTFFSPSGGVDPETDSQDGQGSVDSTQAIPESNETDIATNPNSEKDTVIEVLDKMCRTLDDILADFIELNKHEWNRDNEKDKDNAAETNKEEKNHDDEADEDDAAEVNDKEEKNHDDGDEDDAAETNDEEKSHSDEDEDDAAEMNDALHEDDQVGAEVEGGFEYYYQQRQQQGFTGSVEDWCFDWNKIKGNAVLEENLRKVEEAEARVRRSEEQEEVDLEDEITYWRLVIYNRTLCGMNLKD